MARDDKLTGFGGTDVTFLEFGQIPDNEQLLPMIRYDQLLAWSGREQLKW